MRQHKPKPTVKQTTTRLPNMEKKPQRLYFIDAIRAWAILMMLQGHFIDGLLDAVFKDSSSNVYLIWKYFRGMTAPVFFTVSGFIFTYLLLRGEQPQKPNPRIKKGIKRGLQLLFIGYLLRINILGWLGGYLYNSFYLVDVLHCIGLSILGIIGCYYVTKKIKSKLVFAVLLLAISCILFLYEPQYTGIAYTFLPNALENYISNINGSVFTIIPWFGYTAFGGFLAVLFSKYKLYKHLYPTAIISSIIVGVLLIFYSSKFFAFIANSTETTFLVDVYSNNYLFIRLGDVLLVFAIFMLLRKFLNHKLILKIGQNTLSIYIIHFIILYGSFTGLGLYRFFKYSFSPITAIFGALTFMVVCSALALLYDKHQTEIKEKLNRLKLAILKLFRLVKN